MNRNLWACMRLIVIAFLALLSASSFAFPANFGDRWQGGSVLYATAQEACNAVESRTNTALQQNSTFWGCAYNLDPLMFNAGVYLQRAYYCPANATLSGQNCSCQSGFNEQNGQCVKPDSCSGLAAYCSGLKGVTGMFESRGKWTCLLVRARKRLTIRAALRAVQLRLLVCRCNTKTVLVSG